jgi:hypothetical protein
MMLSSRTGPGLLGEVLSLSDDILQSFDANVLTGYIIGRFGDIYTPPIGSRKASPLVKLRWQSISVDTVSGHRSQRQPTRISI